MAKKRRRLSLLVAMALGLGVSCYSTPNALAADGTASTPTEKTTPTSPVEVSANSAGDSFTIKIGTNDQKNNTQPVTQSNQTLDQMQTTVTDSATKVNTNITFDNSVPLNAVTNKEVNLAPETRVTINGKTDAAHGSITNGVAGNSLVTLNSTDNSTQLNGTNVSVQNLNLSGAKGSTKALDVAVTGNIADVTVQNAGNVTFSNGANLSMGQLNVQNATLTGQNIQAQTVWLNDMGSVKDANVNVSGTLNFGYDFSYNPYWSQATSPSPKSLQNANFTADSVAIYDDGVFKNSETTNYSITTNVVGLVSIAQPINGEQYTPNYDAVGTYAKMSPEDRLKRFHTQDNQQPYVNIGGLSDYSDEGPSDQERARQELLAAGIPADRITTVGMSPEKVIDNASVTIDGTNYSGANLRNAISAFLVRGIHSVSLAPAAAAAIENGGTATIDLPAGKGITVFNGYSPSVQLVASPSATTPTTVTLASTGNDSSSVTAASGNFQTIEIRGNNGVSASNPITTTIDDGITIDSLTISGAAVTANEIHATKLTISPNRREATATTAFKSANGAPVKIYASAIDITSVNDLQGTQLEGSGAMGGGDVVVTMNGGTLTPEILAQVQALAAPNIQVKTGGGVANVNNPAAQTAQSLQQATTWNPSDPASLQNKDADTGVGYKLVNFVGKNPFDPNVHIAGQADLVSFPDNKLTSTQANDATRYMTTLSGYDNMVTALQNAQKNGNYDTFNRTYQMQGANAVTANNVTSVLNGMQTTLQTLKANAPVAQNDRNGHPVTSTTPVSDLVALSTNSSAADVQAYATRVNGNTIAAVEQAGRPLASQSLGGSHMATTVSGVLAGNVQARTADLRGGILNQGNMTGLATLRPTAFQGKNQTKAKTTALWSENLPHLLATLAPTKERPVADNYLNDVWVKIKHGDADIDNGDFYGKSKVKYTTYQLGYDGKTSDTDYLGVYLSTTTGNVRGGGQTTDIKDSFDGGIYGTHEMKNGQYLDWMVHSGSFRNELNGQKWSTRDYGATLGYGAKIHANEKLIVNPYIDFSYDNINTADVNFGGNNIIHSDTQNNFSTRIGVDFQYKSGFYGGIAYGRGLSGSYKASLNGIGMPSVDNDLNAIYLSAGYRSYVGPRTFLDMSAEKSFLDIDGWTASARVNFLF